MYQKMSLVQKIGDEMCVLAVAGLCGRVEDAPVWMNMIITRAEDKDLINKEIPAGSYLSDVVT
jgi:hypothetical protein